MLLETLPLYLLFESSLLVASWAQRRESARAARVAADDDDADVGAPDPLD